MVAVGRGLWAVSYELWATACPICRDVDSFAVELGPGTVLLGDQISISNKEQVVLLGDGSDVPPKIDLQGGKNMHIQSVGLLCLQDLHITNGKSGSGGCLMVQGMEKARQM